jgi:hypothetical protein
VGVKINIPNIRCFFTTVTEVLPIRSRTPSKAVATEYLICVLKVTSQE